MTILSSEKQALDRAFKALRKAGHIARQSHTCCGSCSVSKINSDVRGMPQERREKLAGAVHYHRQNADFMHGNKCLYVSFGQLEVDGAKYGKATEEVGADVVAAMAAEGLCPVWDGDASNCVEVHFEGAYDSVGERIRRALLGSEVAGREAV